MDRVLGGDRATPPPAAAAPQSTAPAGGALRGWRELR